MFGSILGFGIMWLLLGILCLVAFIWAIIDIIGQKKDTGWKVIWVIVCLFLGLIGVIIYYFASGRKKKKK